MQVQLMMPCAFVAVSARRCFLTMPDAATAAAWRPSQRLCRPNTLSGSRKNIEAHYDAGNDMYKVFLDESMTYSCAIYNTPGTQSAAHAYHHSGSYLQAGFSRVGVQPAWAAHGASIVNRGFCRLRSRGITWHSVLACEPDSFAPCCGMRPELLLSQSITMLAPHQLPSHDVQRTACTRPR